MNLDWSATGRITTIFIGVTAGNFMWQAITGTDDYQTAIDRSYWQAVLYLAIMVRKVIEVWRSRDKESTQEAS